MKTMSKVAVALVGAVGLAMAAESAHAVVEVNGAGSSAGRLFAGETPVFICDSSPTPLFFKDTNNPPNLTEWQCNVSGVPTIYRYAASNSSNGFLKQPNGATATENYMVTSTCPAGSAVTIGGHAVLQSVCNPVTTTPKVVHFGASDVKPTSFHQTGNGSSIATPANGHLTTTPVVSVPFALIVGGNVRGKDPVTGNPTTLLSVTRDQAKQIFAGAVTDWTVLGFDTTTADKSITTCQRTVGSGTLAALDEIIMAPSFINPATTAVNPKNIWNASSGNMKSCVENNPNAIGYIDSDTVPNLLLGAYQIGINGQPVNAGALGTGPARMKDIRCGRYIYWADWNIVTRNAGTEVTPFNPIVPGTDLAIQNFITQATLHNPLLDYWVGQNDMFVFKNDDRGPFNWFTPSGNNENAATVCQKAGSSF
jgi:ABC-type phosphate transport system substrate-binding protein